MTDLLKDSDLKKSGFLTLKELKKGNHYPSASDFMKGPVVVAECIEGIPCNPCEEVCKKGAIKIGKPITNLPQIDLSKCSACGLCLAACPGLAIYIKDYTYSEEQAFITFPYEFFPLPKSGQNVIAVNRQGKEICSANVIKVSQSKRNDHTAIISMVYSKKYFHEVISIKRL